MATVWSGRSTWRWTSGTAAEGESRAIDQIEAELAKGAEANGYANDVWTLQRVAEVTERITGVHYHPAHVWYILRDGLGWSWQRPARRAKERNDEAIQQWVNKRWPQLKKGRGVCVTEKHKEVSK